MDTAERAPEMLAALNDILIPRFTELSKSNFAEVLHILRKDATSSQVMNQNDVVDQTLMRNAADRVGDHFFFNSKKHLCLPKLS